MKDWRKIDRRLVEVGRTIGREFKGLLMVDREGLRRELEEANKFKIGRPLEMPDGVVRLAFLFHTLFNMRWRQIEGLLKEMAGEDLVASYRRISERARKYEETGAKIIKLSGGRGKVCIFSDLFEEAESFFIDSTGISLRRRGLWRSVRFKHPITGKWVKMHMITNAEGKIYAFALTNPAVTDSEIFRIIVKHLPKGSKIYGDRAYFARKNYRAAEEQGIEFHSPPKKNARTLAKGSPSYRREVKLYRELGYARWAENTGYKHRFNKEFVFARYKSIFGETTTDRSLNPIFNRLLIHIQILNSPFLNK